jgi:hypothetical protein
VQRGSGNGNKEKAGWHNYITGNYENGIREWNKRME